MASPEHEQIENLIYEQMYEEAREDGEIYLLHATRVDPACWSDDLDIGIEISAVTDEETGEAIAGEYTAKATGKLRGRLLYDREYEFWTGRDGYVHLDNYEECP